MCSCWELVVLAAYQQVLVQVQALMQVLAQVRMQEKRRLF